MDPFEILVEKKLAEAEREGRFRGLPGSGRPLPRDDLDRVPRELRMAYKLLRDAGYLPEELEARRELVRLDDLLAACSEPDQRRELARRRSLQLLRYELLMERRRRTSAHRAYAGKIAGRLG